MAHGVLKQPDSGEEKLEKSIKTIESDLEREKSISLDADLNEKRILKEKEELLKTENQLAQVETNSSKALKESKSFGILLKG